jgi:type II secretory pathway predicted ATPase ExeA
VYEAHFGLEFPPFGETVSPSAYVAVPSRDAVLRRLRYALEHNQGPAVLFGPTGTGKSLLARRLAIDLGGPVLHVTYPALSAVEMMAHLALELGGPRAPARSLDGSLRHVRDHLAALAARGQRLLLVIDDAHLIETASRYGSC